MEVALVIQWHISEIAQARITTSQLKYQVPVELLPLPIRYIYQHVATRRPSQAELQQLKSGLVPEALSGAPAQATLQLVPIQAP